MTLPYSRQANCGLCGASLVTEEYESDLVDLCEACEARCCALDEVDDAAMVCPTCGEPAGPCNCTTSMGERARWEDA